MALTFGDKMILLYDENVFWTGGGGAKANLLSVALTLNSQVIEYTSLWKNVDQNHALFISGFMDSRLKCPNYPKCQLQRS